MFLKLIRGLVQVKTLLFTRHHYVHLVLSYKHRLYLIHIVLIYDLGDTTSTIKRL